MASPPGQSADTEEGKPNVLLVVMDDVGYSDLGCYGSEIHTPNIDSLARDGIRYIRFDTNAVCSATRASLLTGRNSQTVKMGFLAATDTDRLRRATGANPNSKAFNERLAVNPGWRDPHDESPERGWMPDNAETIAQVLKNDGYATWAIGKWHLAPSGRTGHQATIKTFLFKEALTTSTDIGMDGRINIVRSSFKTTLVFQSQSIRMVTGYDGHVCLARNVEDDLRLGRWLAREEVMPESVGRKVRSERYDDARNRRQPIPRAKLV